jgi:hypothetical protein
MARLMSPEEFAKDWDKRVRQLDKQVSNSVTKTAKYGQQTAQQLAPKATTTLAQAIVWNTRGKNGALIYIKAIDNPTGGVTTKYAKIMHSGKGPNVWKSGDRYFMFTTRKKVNEDLNKNIKIAVGEFLGKSPK